MVDFQSVQIFAGCETGMAISYFLQIELEMGSFICGGGGGCCSTFILEIESVDCMCHFPPVQNVIVLQLAKSVFVSP